MSAARAIDTTAPDSLWAATAAAGPHCAPLARDVAAELCVIGGGFTGLSAALHAAQAGLDVVLLEVAEPGWGAAGRNGGQVIPGLKLDPDELERRFGELRGRRLSDFAGAAPDLVFELVAKHRIECGARRSGWINAVHGRAALPRATERLRQWNARGAALELLDRARVAELLGCGAYLAGLLDPRGGWLQPLAYARGLARAAQAAGASLHGGTPALHIDAEREGWRIATPAGTVRARRALVCTNAYTERLCAPLARSLIPVTSFQVATEPLRDELRARILPQGHVCSDTRRVLRYFCVTPEGRLVMGGRGHGRAPERRELYAHIVASLRELFPEAARAKLDYFWSGRVALTLDHLPKIYELGPGLWAGGGYNGRGVAMATALGSLLAELATGAPGDALPLAPEKPRPIPLHGLRGPAIGAAVSWKRLLDGWEARAR